MLPVNNARFQAERLSKILLRLSIACAVLSALSMISIVVYASYFVLLFAVALLSLFTLFADPEFFKLFSNSSESYGVLVTFINSITPYFAIAGMVTAILSVVFNLLSLNSKRSVPRIIGAIAIAVVLLIIAIVCFKKQEVAA